MESCRKTKRNKTETTQFTTLLKPQKAKKIQNSLLNRKIKKRQSPTTEQKLNQKRLNIH